MRLAEKTFVPSANGQPAQDERRYDTACTPFDRLCATEALSQEQRRELQRRRDTINPRQLRREIYHDLERLFALPGAVPGKVEDVFHTLIPSGRIQRREGWEWSPPATSCLT